MQAQQCVAHRGYRQHFPENTLLAHQQAVKVGARFIETDIQMSADGVPVLYHDMDMTRLSGLNQRLDLVTGEELVRLPACEPGRFGERFRDERIASLDAFTRWLQTVPHVTAYIEIKTECRQRFGDEAVSRILAPLRRIYPQIVVISFDLQSIALARQLGAPRVGVVLEHWETLDDPLLRQIQPDVIFCDQLLVPDAVQLSEYPTPFVIYEVSDPEQAELWMARGAYQIETYQIGAMLGDTVTSNEYTGESQ